MAEKKTVKKTVKKVAKKVAKKAVKKVVKKAVETSVEKTLPSQTPKSNDKKETDQTPVMNESTMAKELTLKPSKKTTKKVVKKSVKKSVDELLDEAVEVKSKDAPVKTSKSEHDLETDNEGKSENKIVQRSAQSKESPILALVIKASPQLIDDVLAGKKFLRQNFLTEINETEERINKKKYSEIRPVEALTRVSRSKERKMDESPEELISRIARELEEEQAVRENPYASFNCAKCNELPIAEQFRIDKGFGYCEICAELLGLGQTKEAKSFEFGLGRTESSSDDDSDDEAV